ncbi:hypothetical protein [Amycolatopsis pithecellobii]|uniref:Uncharacterized protein n=1 Tax=Amycolatopsis pithecellobii TaxID=664692 RepID=A0A6N7Z1S2_9PSEU|nr:hypothetical protein [Amycolatopsis pithecellobii]MTD54769.1 hypothetical protein [Amycolatopsis pithecellobii]
MNNVNIGGDNYGAFNVGGKVSGDLSGATVHNPRLAELLGQLREEAPQAKAELTRLREDVASGAAKPAEVRSRWEKIKELLTGVSEVSGPVTKTVTAVHELISAL